MSEYNEQNSRCPRCGFSEEEMQSLQQFFERIYENLLRDQQKEE